MAFTISSFAKELGLTALSQSPRDTWILILQRSLRMLGFGLTNLSLALFFNELGLRDAEIGLFFTCTLLGDVLLSLGLTLVADRLGRRNVLIGGSALMALSGVVFALSERYWALLVAAIMGVISVSGSEIGPFRAIEESTLAHLTTADSRTYVLTWYVVTAALGTATGVGLSGVIVTFLQSHLGWAVLSSYHFIFWMYAVIGVANLTLSFLLSDRCELKPVTAQGAQKSTATGEARSKDPEDRRLLEEEEGEDHSEGEMNVDGNKATEKPAAKGTKKSMFSAVSRESWGVLIRLCTLMALDSFASGMVPFSLINYYVDGKFQLPKDKLGSIMSVTWLFSAISNMFAGSIAKRIGLVKTMVFTHLPSAVFLAMLPIPSSLTATIVLLFARACLSSMDQAPRSAFIAAIVKPEERTAVMGIVNVLKTLAQSAGPWTTGGLAEQGLFWIAFVTAGALKATYDILLLVMFLGTKFRDNKEPTNVQAAREMQSLQPREDAGPSSASAVRHI